MAFNFRPYIRLTVLVALIGYFSAQALTGERGLLNGTERHEELAARRAELAELQATHQELSARVAGLSDATLSIDMLEERARVVLGFARPDEYVIRQGPSQPL
ncbi:MAG: septum formation initiator family protein [Caulobacterales bacterium]|nr:septum formation initiator family protein [Caulobacterales bacterium]